MVFPIGDDNTGRLRTPYVTYLLIAMNVLVFVFLQGMGNNEQFTYAFSTVPQEIRTGEDVAGNVRIEVGDQSAVIPLQQTPGSRLSHAAGVDVHARQPDAPARQHAVPVDLRRQHRGRPRARPLHGVLSRDRRPRLDRARRLDLRLRRQPVHPEPRRVGRHLGCDGRAIS